MVLFYRNFVSLQHQKSIHHTNEKTTLLLALFLSVTSISAYADSVRTIVENNESITSNVQQNQISNRSLELIL